MLTCLNPLNSALCIYIYVVFPCDSVSKWPFGVFVSRSWTEVRLHLRQGRCTCGHGISEPRGFLGDGPWVSGCWIRKELNLIYFDMPWCWNQWCENTFTVPDGTIKSTKASFRRNPPNVWWRHILFGNWKLSDLFGQVCKVWACVKARFLCFPKGEGKEMTKRGEKSAISTRCPWSPLTFSGGSGHAISFIWFRHPILLPSIGVILSNEHFAYRFLLGSNKKYGTWSAM